MGLPLSSIPARRRTTRGPPSRTIRPKTIGAHSPRGAARRPVDDDCCTCARLAAPRRIGRCLGGAWECGNAGVHRRVRGLHRRRRSRIGHLGSPLGGGRSATAAVRNSLRRSTDRSGPVCHPVVHVWRSGRTLHSCLFRHRRPIHCLAMAERHGLAECSGECWRTEFRDNAGTNRLLGIFHGIPDGLVGWRCMDRGCWSFSLPVPASRSSER